MKTYVLFHHPCTDGMGARFAAWKKFGDSAEYLGVNYGQPMPLIPDGAEIYIIDFSYPKAELRALKARSSKLVVLDHHKSAQEDLVDEDYAIFDMNRSGAVMAWEYFHPGTPVPTLLQMVQDRDLWQWKLAGTKPVLNALNLVHSDMGAWDRYKDNTSELESRGTVISLYQQTLIDSAVVKGKVTRLEFEGLSSLWVNSMILPSEVNEALYKDSNVDFTCTYQIGGDGVVFLSLRSKFGTGCDVSQVGRAFNGGGHRHSAGGRTTLARLVELLNSGEVYVPET